MASSHRGISASMRVGATGTYLCDFEVFPPMANDGRRGILQAAITKTSTQTILR